jgi:hypothetical protein
VIALLPVLCGMVDSHSRAPISTATKDLGLGGAPNR